MIRSLSRRRFLAIAASGAMMPSVAPAATVSWRGRALGAEATITLGGIGRASATEMFQAITAELARLEDIFSLYRDHSALSRLNRDGQLAAPPGDLVTVLNLCDALFDASQGAFDPTIQPVWSLLAKASCESAQDYRAARQLIGWGGVDISADRIAFARPGMAITLNGIAQGYVTDRVAGLLRARGFDNVLIDMGEIAALGRNNGAPWAASIALPDGQAVDRLTLTDRCLAVSAPGGTKLCGIDHILEPRAGGAPIPRTLAAVSAGKAVVADGLSTACCLLNDKDAKTAVEQFPGALLETLI